MADHFKRTETTHIDEVSRTSTSTVQWLLEMANIAGTHPISHNNKLTFLIGGEDAFADIAKHIVQAKASIDICCWGFDPGKELIRGDGVHWPRGDTYGDLLIAAGKRGVKVRLLVWYDATAVKLANPRNMPGFTHDVDYGRSMKSDIYKNWDARRSIAQAQEEGKTTNADFGMNDAPFVARKRYCMDWYDAAFSGKLANIEIRRRSGDAAAIEKSLASEANPPSNGGSMGAERQGMVHFGTHHQKPILFDFFHDEGSAAVGYIMGLNSLTEYWDTAAHRLDDPRREHEWAVGVQATPGCQHLRPFRDYACRIDGGRALVAIYNNFVKAWERAAPSKPRSGYKEESTSQGMPAACLRKAEPGDSTVQVVRTQPEESDKTIKEAYFQATDQAALAMGYIYLENQYFQYTEWAQRLMKVRKTVMERWHCACASAGKTARDMPVLHVFVVIPVPERVSMIPRTYDTLATLGQQAAMKGQTAMIKQVNEQRSTGLGGIGQPAGGGATMPEVVIDANRIDKPNEQLLETSYGLKVCTAMLNACDFANGEWQYREIYIHSKLLLIDDTFLTMGSANLNQRSMAVDSEINLAAIAPDKANDLRRRIWGQLSGGGVTGGKGSRIEIAWAFNNWIDLMYQNVARKTKGKQISGLLLPMEDKRSSTIRLG